MKRKSVLQDWVMELPLREQGTLLTAIRGCDMVPKLPYDSLPRSMTAFIRFLIMNPADPREVGITGAFFQSTPPDLKVHKMSELGHLPEHWYSHMMHSFEVCGYRHPNVKLRKIAYQIYFAMCRNLHLPPESRKDMIKRLSEDRIATNTVVS